MTETGDGWSEFVCWQCGGAADAGCVFTAGLVADPKRAPDAMGYPVSTRNNQLTTHVPVPRCRGCRARSRADALSFIGGMAGGAAMLGGLYWSIGQQGGWPDGFVMIDPEFTLWALAIGGAFLGGFSAVAVRLWGPGRPRSGAVRRPYDDFPPIAALRARGWNWPSSPSD